LTRKRRPRVGGDHYTRQARARNFPARSIFKLEEIDRKHRLFRPGRAVLDLGCAPGSWLMYAADQVGDKGLVVGVDQHGLKVDLPKNARYLRGDALAVDAEELSSLWPEPFDVVLSDMAPHTSGNRFVDQQRSLRLVLRALEIADELCGRGGAFLGKVFHGEDIAEATSRAKELFATVRLVKPKAVRKGSYEIYLLALDRKEPPPATDEPRVETQSESPED